MTKPEVSKTAPPELSVVVLCYRAEDWARTFVPQVQEELERSGIDYEIVLVGNYLEGSGDRTPEILLELARSQPRYKVVAQVKEGMMGWDMRSGLEATIGNHICVIDGDGQMPPSDIVKVYRLLQVGNYDLVKTFRSQRHDGLYRKVLTRVYNFLFNVTFRPGVRYIDINAKPKVMTRAAYEKMELLSSDWFTDAEIMIEAIRHQLKVGEVSAVFLANQRRTSFVTLTSIWEFISNLVYYRFRKNRHKKNDDR